MGEIQSLIDTGTDQQQLLDRRFSWNQPMNVEDDIYAGDNNAEKRQAMTIKEKITSLKQMNTSYDQQWNTRE